MSLEKQYRALPKPFKRCGRRILALPSHRITAEHLRAVMDHELLAIRVPRLVPPDDCRYIAEFVRRHPPKRRYRVEPQFKLFGRARFEGTDGAEALAAYFKQGLAVMRRVTQGIAPATPPWVRILTLLNEVWPTGAVFQRFGGRLGQVGLVRVVKAGGRVLPHQDMAAWDDPTDADIAQFTGILSVVAYIRMPPRGGGLGLHGVGFTDEADYKAHLLPGSEYAIDTNAIGSKPTWLQPADGEGVIFAPDLLHEVAVPEDLRATVSLFAVRRGPADPVGLFS